MTVTAPGFDSGSAKSWRSLCEVHADGTERRHRDTARLVGPVLLALGLTEHRVLDADPPSPYHVYLNGTLLLTAGLAIARQAGRPDTWLAGAVSVTGWTTAAAGLTRVWSPEAPQPHNAPAVRAGLAALALAGAGLTAAGHWPRV